MGRFQHACVDRQPQTVADAVAKITQDLQEGRGAGQLGRKRAEIKTRLGDV